MCYIVKVYLDVKVYFRIFLILRLGVMIGQLYVQAALTSGKLL